MANVKNEKVLPLVSYSQKIGYYISSSLYGSIRILLCYSLALMLFFICFHRRDIDHRRICCCTQRENIIKLEGITENQLSPTCVCELYALQAPPVCCATSRGSMVKPSTVCQEDVFLFAFQICTFIDTRHSALRDKKETLQSCIYVYKKCSEYRVRSLHTINFHSSTTFFDFVPSAVRIRV